MNFEQAVSRVASVSGAVVANSQELLARAGFKVNEILTAMPHLLFITGAEGMMSRAVDIASGTLKGFGMEASEMGKVASRQQTGVVLYS